MDTEIKKTIYLAADHAGYYLKEDIKKYLSDMGREYVDEGAYGYDANDDYPDFASKVAKKISEDPEHSMGIVFGGSGQGEAILANKYPNVRAAVYYGSSPDIITLCRDHNDANVLSIGARFVSPVDAQKAVRSWMEKSFSNDGRHVRRIQKIQNSEFVVGMVAVKARLGRKAIVPAILDQSLDSAIKKLSSLQGHASFIQIDVMDGTYVSENTFSIHEFRADRWPMFFEAHLMVNDPIRYIRMCKISGMRRVVFHPEAIEMRAEEVIQAIRANDMESGIAINPHSDIESLSRLFSSVDQILVMGVDPGKSGQEMLPDTILRVRSCREKAPWSVRIAVDGGVTKENAKAIFLSGADMLVVGSGIFSAGKKPKDAFLEYEQQLRNTW